MRNIKNPYAMIRIILFCIVCSFFLLFAEVALIRYLSLIFPGITFLAFLHSIIGSTFVKVKRDEEIIRGIKLKDIEIHLSIRNKMPFSITYFTVSDAKGELFSKGGSFLLTLGSFEKKKVSYILRGHKRGKFKLGPITLKGSDFLGFFPWEKTIYSIMDVVIFPTIYPISLINRLGLPSGNLKINNKMYEDVTQFRSLREYVPGDDLKRINWKASAKTGTLYTMEFDSTLYFPVLVVLNFSSDDFSPRHKGFQIEKAAEIAASIAFYYVEIKQTIGLISTGKISDTDKYVIIPGKSGSEHAQEIMETISCLQPVNDTADFNHLLFQSGVHIPMGVKILVITPHPNQQQAESIIAAKRRGYNIQVLQVESLIAYTEDDHLAGAVNVINSKDIESESADGK